MGCVWCRQGKRVFPFVVRARIIGHFSLFLFVGRRLQHTRNKTYENRAPHIYYYYFNIPADGFCRHKKNVAFCIGRDEMIDFCAVSPPPRLCTRMWFVTVIGFRTRPLDKRFTRTYVGCMRIGIRSHINQNVPGLTTGKKNTFFHSTPDDVLTSVLSRPLSNLIIEYRKCFSSETSFRATCPTLEILPSVKKRFSSSPYGPVFSSRFHPSIRLFAQ